MRVACRKVIKRGRNTSIMPLLCSFLFLSRERVKIYLCTAHRKKPPPPPKNAVKCTDSNYRLSNEPTRWKTLTLNDGKCNNTKYESIRLTNALRALPTQATSKLDVLGLNGDTLGMDGGQISVLKKGNKVGFGGLLEGADSG